MPQKLKIFVSLAYALIFLVFMGMSALQTHADNPAQGVVLDWAEVELKKIN